MNSDEHAAAQPGPSPDAPRDRAGVVYSFVCELIARYQRWQASPAGALAAEQLPSLLLAEAAMRLATSAGRVADRPTQLVVIGPTQVGKSTVVNLLVGHEVSQVSPLAGFTVHPQGWWLAPADAADTWTRALFPNWRRCPPAELPRDDLQAYALRPFEPPFALSNDVPAAPGLPACVVWDTPDFDSLAAGQYQRGVLETAALADVYLLVLSKEKYSDLSVWKMLKLLAPLQRPLLICLNKLTADSAGVVAGSLRERLAEFGADWGAVPIVTVAYSAQLAAEQPSGTPRAYAVDLVQPLVETVSEWLTGPRRRPTAGVQALVAGHWPAWTAPVQAEHAALDEWNRQIDRALEQFLERYRRDYLDHPHRFDSFRRAAVELLELLEIPKLSNWVTAARQTVTWPLRQLWAAGGAWRRRRAAGATHDLGAEAAVLTDTLETLLTTLQREVVRRCDPTCPGFAVWQALGARLQSEEGHLRETFSGAIAAHHAEVTREIHTAATELYTQLKKQPARLVALRTGRATLDVGALLLAVKTGGLSPMDALWAPATLALSSLLVEGFAGAQMAGVSRRLKERQLAAARDKLVGLTLAQELRKLARGLDDAGLLAVSPDGLAAANQALEIWQEGQGDG